MVTRTNLVPNPRFETNLSGWSNDADYTLNAGSGGAISGGYVKQVSASGYANFTTENDSNGIPLATNTDYVATFYVKVTSQSGNLPHFQLNFDSAYGTQITDQEVPGRGSWQRVRVKFNSGTHTLLYFRIYNNNGAITAFYSNFMVELAANEGDYFDGGFSNTSLDHYAWTGTADASSSTDALQYTLTTKTFTVDGIIKGINTYTFTVDAIIHDPNLNLGTDLINESMASTPIGTFAGNATYVAPSYVRLTAAVNSEHGSLDYSRSIPTTLIFEVDFYANGGADANYAYWGCSSVPTDEDSDFGGYLVAMDEYSGDANKPIFLQWRGTVLAQSAFPHNLGDATKRTLKIVQDGTRIIVYVNNVKLIDFTDTTRVFGGNHIGVGARTGGVNAEHRVYRIHAYPFTSPWHPTIVQAGLATLPYRSIDVMKLTKDTVNSQLTSSQVAAVLKAITNTFTNLTHIAIAVPLNIDSDYAAVGIVPSPSTERNYTQTWCDAIHNLGLNVIFRGDFNELERSASGPTGNWNAILKVGVNRLPRGTTTSAPTDHQTTWLGRLYDLITNNPTWFKNGDIWSPMPERTENNTEIISISNISRVGTTATVTTPINHNVGDQQPVTISGANQSDYNGSFIATKINDTSFSYQVANSPVTPATGTLQLQFGVSVFDDGNSFIDNTGSGVNANYEQFFKDVKTVADSAFSSINKNIKTGFSSNNYSEVNSGWIPNGLETWLGRTVIDHYGVDHTPGEMYNNLVNLFNSIGEIIDHQEWSDYWDGSMATQTRIDYLTDFYNMLVELFDEGIYEMLNYWGGWVGGTGEGILIDNSTPGSPSYAINTFGQILSQYFNPIPIPVTPSVSTGFFLNGIKLKNPIEFNRDYVYRRTDTLVMSGKSVRDFSGLKQKYNLKFKNLNAQQVSDITAIMELHTPVTFISNANGQLNINTTVWPYLGSIVYQRLGSDYLADASIELVEVVSPS